MYARRFRLLHNVLQGFWKGPSTTIYGIVQILCKDIVEGWRGQETSTTYYNDPSRTPTPSRHTEYLLLLSLRYYPPSIAIFPRPQVTFTSITPSSRTSAHRLRDVIRTGRRSFISCNRGRRDREKQTNFTSSLALLPWVFKQCVPSSPGFLFLYSTTTARPGR
jgi:hypothetical protein